MFERKYDGEGKWGLVTEGVVRDVFRRYFGNVAETVDAVIADLRQGIIRRSASTQYRKVATKRGAWKTYEYWTHGKSGEVWAVEIDEIRQVVVGSCGPLGGKQRPLDMRDFEYNPETGEWINENFDDFLRLEG